MEFVAFGRRIAGGEVVGIDPVGHAVDVVPAGQPAEVLLLAASHHDDGVGAGDPRGLRDGAGQHVRRLVEGGDHPVAAAQRRMAQEAELVFAVQDVEHGLGNEIDADQQLGLGAEVLEAVPFRIDGAHPAEALGIARVKEMEDPARTVVGAVHVAAELVVAGMGGMVVDAFPDVEYLHGSV